MGGFNSGYTVPAPLIRGKLYILDIHLQTMKRLGLVDVLYLSLDSLKNQPSLVIPVFSTIILDLLIFSLIFGTFSSVPELLEMIPVLLGKALSQVVVMSAIFYLLLVCGASVVCGMTKVGIAEGESSIARGAQEAESYIFSVIVAFLIAGAISGVLLLGGVMVVAQVMVEPGIVSALLYAFVILLGFMLGILFLYTMPAIIVDGLDSITAIGLSIGIVLNHLRDSLVLALLTLVLLFAVYFSSLFLPGLIHLLFFLVSASLVITVLVIAVTVDYVNVK